MKRRRCTGLILSKLLVVVFTLLILTSCGGTGIFHTPPPLIESETEEPNTVFVTRGTVENLTIEPGITRFPTVSAQLETGSGYIKTIYAMPGDVVYEGQVIARLDTPELDEMIESLESMITNERRRHQLFLRESSAMIDLQNLLDSDAQVALLRLERRHASARHDVEIEDMEIRLANLLERRAHAEITAPVAGEVVSALLPGIWVNAHDIVSHIVLSEGLFVEYIGVPQVLWNYERIQGIIDGVVYDLTPLRLSRAERVELQNLGVTLPARFSIDTNSSDLLGAGKTVFIKGYTSHVEDTLRLPSYAIYFPPPINAGWMQSYVYRLNDGKQELVYVTVGVITDQYTEILHGLEEGDEIFVRP